MKEKKKTEEKTLWIQLWLGEKRHIECFSLLIFLNKNNLSFRHFFFCFSSFTSFHNHTRRRHVFFCSRKTTPFRLILNKYLKCKRARLFILFTKDNKNFNKTNRYYRNVVFSFLILFKISFSLLYGRVIKILEDRYVNVNFLSD